jgi:hypothetical protein
MPNKPHQQSEAARKSWDRLDALIGERFIGSNMSTTKWVKLMQAAAMFAATVPRMNYKLVYGPEVQSSHTPFYAESVEFDWFREPFIYKEVEWVEFPFTYEVPRGSGLASFVRQQDIASLRNHLEGIANFPLQETKTGLRVVAYVEA